MAFIDTMMETSNGSMKKIKVPSSQGGTDRIIYVNGSDSGYRLGNSNDYIYNHRSGEQVSTASIKAFVKQMLWLN